MILAAYWHDGRWYFFALRLATQVASAVSGAGVGSGVAVSSGAAVSGAGVTGGTLRSVVMTTADAGVCAARTAAKPAYPTVTASTSTSSTNHHVFRSRAARGAYCSASSSTAASNAAMPQPTCPQASRTMLPMTQAQPSSTFQMRFHPICILIFPPQSSKCGFSFLPLRSINCLFYPFP